MEGETAGEMGSRGAGGKREGSSVSVLPTHPRTHAPTLSELSAISPNASVPSRAKHVPERTCAACRTKKPQGELYRIRKTLQGWTIDSSVTVGRSAYLCSSPYCHVEKRLKRTFGAQAAQISSYLSEVLRTLEGQKEKLSGANIG